MMRFVLHTNTISPHQLPLAREIAANVGEENFRYVYTEVADKDHGGLGWSLDVPEWCVHADAADVDEWLDGADILLSGLRCFDLFERRAKKGLKNFYMTERWLKPPIGIARLLHPRYFGYEWRLCRMMESGAVIGLPIGVHAARDMARLCGLMHGDVRCLFSVPEIDFEMRPGGRLVVSRQSLVDRRESLVASRQSLVGSGDKYCLGRMRMWGYFVEPSNLTTNDQRLTTNTLKVLWVGRMLDWKRVDTIIRAVKSLVVSRETQVVSRQSLVVSGDGRESLVVNGDAWQVAFDIYGAGPEEPCLKKLADTYGDIIKFHPPVPIVEVRKLMREHDVYVLSSNGYEGWGAVVSEALEEGMKVIGTYEAGSSATMLSDEDLFHAGDWRRLAELIARCASEKCEGKLVGQGIGEWTAGNAGALVVGR